ncbi:hypothetical protein ACFQ7S_38735, partial [Streptomyces sp. NPDC056491]
PIKETRASGQPPLAVRTPRTASGSPTSPAHQQAPRPRRLPPVHTEGSTDIAPYGSRPARDRRHRRRPGPARPAPVPVLAAIRLGAATGALTVAAFDYETSAQATVEAAVTTPGTVLVSGRFLADITRTIKGSHPVDPNSTASAWS